MSSQKLPAWPSFTILEPEKNAADWLAIPFPESFRHVEQATLVEAVPPEYRVDGVAAACVSAAVIAKKHKISVAEIKNLIAGKPYIVH